MPRQKLVTIFLDNSALRLWNTGTVVQGGHVLETPGHLEIGSSEFQAWHWSSNIGPYLSALKDHLETSASWSRDGQRKYLMINVSNSWDDSFVSMDVADILLLEFEYDPVRNSGLGAVAEAYRRDRLAADAGITSFYAPLMATTASGQPGSISREQALYGSLTWYLVSRTEGTLLFLFGDVTSPATTGWVDLTWSGAVDVANANLGMAVGAPYEYATGTDPMGNSYVVMARDYENGLALVRNRGRWNEGILPETSTSISLSQPLSPVSRTGVVEAPVTSISLANGEGVVLLGGSEE